MKTSSYVLFIVSLKCVLGCLISFGQFPLVYDLRTMGLVTPVRDQGSTCGSCWAFATCAAIESQWLKLGFGMSDLSEDNIIDCHGFDESPCSGGSFYMSQAMLSAHKGIFPEAIDPYTPSTQNCPLNLSFPPSPIAFVEDMIMIPPVRNVIKTALTTYGAVATTMFFNPANYNSAKYKYYDSFISSTDSLYAHCVTIAGWNDTMSFAGAPATGGWIIKDSYGTGWAQNGYFYCSYYDAGILGENAVFPVRYEVPSAQNKSHVYAHDQLGWIDNYGTGANVAWGLVKYTLLPSGGIICPQQVKRIGTYAVADNTTLEISVWKNKNGNILSGFVSSTTKLCQYKGFYSIPFYIQSDTIQSVYYIKVKYQCPPGIQQPIPIEKSELGHSTGVTLSTNACWVSSDGNQWLTTGNGTTRLFDLCIKMYAENAPQAKMGNLPDTVCVGSQVLLQDQSPMPKDSCHWYINQVFLSNAPALPYLFSVAGNAEIMLVVWLGQNTDTVKKSITIAPNPPIPVISQSGNMLISTNASAYQWLDHMMNPILGAIQQTFYPPANGIYYVVNYNEAGCEAVSAPFLYTTTLIEEPFNKPFKLFPNPTTGIINLLFSNCSNETYSINIFDITGKRVFKQFFVDINEPYHVVNISHLPKGNYLFIIYNSQNVFYKTLLTKEE